jgi:hypothetical protein
MFRHRLSRLIRPFKNAQRSREKARGIRGHVAIPYDMFDEIRSCTDARAARKLAEVYHKGQKHVWDGRKVLDDLRHKHGEITLSDEKKHALLKILAVLLWGELAAWKISADLALHLEPLEAKMAATAQAHDEARHFYVMYEYMSLLGDVPHELGDAAEAVLMGTLQTRDLTRKLMGMQLMIEPMALTLFQLIRRHEIDPLLGELLVLYQRDEARHVALGVLHLPKLLRAMGPVEAVGLWTWQFRQFWREFSLVRELEDELSVLGIDAADVVRIGRGKQIRANQMLIEEFGEDLRVVDAFIRFFDGKAEWEFPTHCTRNHYPARLAHAFAAARDGKGAVPRNLVNA